MADRRLADPELPCSGCAHSASGAPFPGHPSGERPCGFCVRNPWKDDGGWPYCVDEEGRGLMYDGTPVRKTPMDCYLSTDRLTELLYRDHGG